MITKLCAKQYLASIIIGVCNKICMNWWLRRSGTGFKVLWYSPSVCGCPLSLSLHWFSCQFPSPGARPGCHAPFTAVRISAQKNRKIHKIIPYLTKTLSITQRSGMKRCVPRRKLYKIDFLCVWGWGKLVEFPLFLSKCVFSFVIFCFARLGLVPASARGRGSVQAGLQPMQKTFNQLKH